MPMLALQRLLISNWIWFYLMTNLIAVWLDRADSSQWDILHARNPN
jgi:hypothetical protein